METPATSGNAPATSSSAPATPAGGGTTAPASSTPATATPSTPSSPRNAQEAMERASASASSAENPQGEVKPGGAASTTPPAAPAGDVFHMPRTKEEYDRIMDNARQKAVDAYKAQHGWAENYKSDDVREMSEFFQEVSRDPRAFAQQILAEGEEEKELVDPEADYTSPDGKAKFYSDSVVKTMLSNLEKRMERKFKPAMTLAEQQEQQARLAPVIADARKTADEVVAAVSKYPGFAENKKAIGEKLQSMDVALRRRIGAPAALLMCYNAVMQEKAPENEAAIEKRVREGFGKQAAAGIGHVTPGSQPITRKPVRDGDVEGLAARMAELNSEMSGTT